MIKIVWQSTRTGKHTSIKEDMYEAHTYVSRVRRFMVGEPEIIDLDEEAEKVEKVNAGVTAAAEAAKMIKEVGEPIGEVKKPIVEATRDVQYAGRVAKVPVNIPTNEIISSCKLLKQGGYKVELRDKGLRVSIQVTGHKWRNEYIPWGDFSETSVADFIMDRAVGGMLL